MTQLLGIDVSHWQANIDWQKVQRDGKVFAFAKASEGTHFVDPNFSANWQQMKNVGLIRGAYHYFRALEDPIQQANLYLQTVTLEADDLPPTLDVEIVGNEQATNAQFVNGVKIWMRAIHQKTGRTPMIYTGSGIWNSHLSNDFGNYPLWVAHWGVQQPTLPHGFNSFAFWQYDNRGRVNGLKGNVDLDLFEGTQEQLKTFIATH